MNIVIFIWRAYVFFSRCSQKEYETSAVKFLNGNVTGSLDGHDPETCGITSRSMTYDSFGSNFRRILESLTSVLQKNKIGLVELF